MVSICRTGDTGEKMAGRKFSYEEPREALTSRITAHRQYSDFDLHGWIRKKFAISSGSRVLDLGCGNGNFTGLFWDSVKPGGSVVGLDKNSGVIADARKIHKGLPKDRVKYFVQDFDEPFPDFGISFDWIFSVYSLYYTEDSGRILDVTKSLLAPQGAYVVIGPGPKNVRDLTTFSEKLTGRKANKEHLERIERISGEFYPLFMKIFSKENVTYEESDTLMTFPDAKSFGEYYWSTLLWRDSVEDFSAEKIEFLKGETLKYAAAQAPIQIKKQISCLVGRLT